MERLASGEGRKGLRWRLEERVEKRGAELQELFGECGFGGWRSEAAAQRCEGSVFFSLPRSLLEWYGSLIEEVREGLEGAGDEVWEELMFYGSIGAEEATLALAAKRLILPGEVKVIAEGASTFQVGSLLDETIRRAREEAMPS
ncbi:MAG: hypothetical protein QXJ21_09905 [Thermofilum sp.]